MKSIVFTYIIRQWSYSKYPNKKDIFKRIKDARYINVDISHFFFEIFVRKI